MNEKDFWELEKSLWVSGHAIYEQHMAEQGFMAFLPPWGIMNKSQTIAALQAAPRWHHVTFRDTRLTLIDQHACALAYTAEARKTPDDQPYRALCSTFYAQNRGRWQLIAHQQTPLAPAANQP